MPTADELLGRDVAVRLAATVGRAAPGRPLPALEAAAAPGALEGLALRARADLMAGALLADVPEGFPELAGIVHEALADGEFTGWLVWPVGEAVAAAALAAGAPTDAFDAAMELLALLTPRLTSEFAVRGLLAADLRRALRHVLGWTRHPDPHVRRLASEGTRPHLPWARKVRAVLDAPECTVPVLDALYRDPSAYVRRSVANHLNDVSRQAPDLAVATAARWLADGDAHTPRVVRHGLRTLVKRGDAEALALLGFGPAPAVTVKGPLLAADTVAVGGHLPFDVVLANTGQEPAALAVDYVVHHLKADGSLRPKVFKLATRTLGPGESATLHRRHSFAPVSTRVYYPGEHAVEVQVNGVASGRVAFRLADGG